MTDTALTTAIKHAQKQSQIQGDDRYDDGYKAAMCAMSFYLISLLPKEREDMDKAYAAGFIDDVDSYRATYFTDNFSQYKP